MNYKKWIGIGVLTALLFRAIPACAWGTDPTRAATWAWTSKMQTGALMGNTAAITVNMGMKHMLDCEQDSLVKLQQELNDYLDNFHDVLVIGAETIGIGYELWHVKINASRLLKLLGDPSYLDNALAVQLSVDRNSVYTDLITNASGLITVINSLVFNRNAKMSENEKYKLAFSLRPKLRDLNNSLITLEHYIRSTTLLTVWDEIIDRAYGYRRLSTRTICTRACMRWRSSALAHMVNPRPDRGTIGTVGTFEGSDISLENPDNWAIGNAQGTTR